MNSINISRKLMECDINLYDKYAMISGNEKITYKEMNEKIDKAAQYLISRGIVKGTHTAIYMNRSAEMIIYILAVIKIGAVYIPLDPAYPEERIKYIINDSNTEYVLADKDSEKSLFKKNVTIINVRLSNYNSAEKEFIKYDETHEQDPAMIIYTSG